MSDVVDTYLDTLRRYVLDYENETLSDALDDLWYKQMNAEQHLEATRRWVAEKAAESTSMARAAEPKT